MCKRVYLQDSYAFNATSKILKYDTDLAGPYVTLDRTIFYPQGGGQPADLGLLEGTDFQAHITNVRQVGDEIRHYVDQNLANKVDQTVEACIDEDRRLNNARYHTTGHLISAIVETNLPRAQATKGHHFPGESYVEFSLSPESTIGIEWLQAEIESCLEDNLTVETLFAPAKDIIERFPYIAKFTKPDEQVRMIQIGNFPPAPCGGTHVRSLAGMQVAIEDCKSRGSSVRVKYKVKEQRPPSDSPYPSSTANY